MYHKSKPVRQVKLAGNVSNRLGTDMSFLRIIQCNSLDVSCPNHCVCPKSSPSFNAQGFMMLLEMSYFGAKKLEWTLPKVPWTPESL